MGITRQGCRFSPRAVRLAALLLAIVAGVITLACLMSASSGSNTNATGSSGIYTPTGSTYLLMHEAHNVPGYMYLLSSDCTRVIATIPVRDRPVPQDLQLLPTSTKLPVVIADSGTYVPHLTCASPAQLGAADAIYFWTRTNVLIYSEASPWVFSTLPRKAAVAAGIIPPRG